jgi:hypothetical protein
MMLSLDTAYRSFGGEVEASSTPTICRLSDSRRACFFLLKFGRARNWGAVALEAAHLRECRAGSGETLPAVF